LMFGSNDTGSRNDEKIPSKSRAKNVISTATGRLIRNFTIG
jgi:hypothetical protein